MSLVKFEIEGLSDLEQALGELSKATRRNVARRAMKKALEPVIETARQLAPDGNPSAPGLKESLVLATRVDRRYRDIPTEKDEVPMWAGPAALPHAHLVEFGTAPRYQKKTGRYVGVMPARPFLRPAWDLHERQILSRISEVLSAEIEKSVARVRRKAARQG